jgi:ABC-type lipoprotein export system ATPase subunit
VTPAIEIKGLVKDYVDPDGAAVRVLDIAALQLNAGHAMAIAGPSGTGKTTLINIIAGLLLPTSGSVHVLGEEIGRMGEAQRDRFRARQIGYVFQTGNLLAGFSALENVLLAMGFAGTVPAAQRRPRAQALLERVGLEQRLHYRPAQLSSGQQQRVAVARALANQPALVLADEPTAHVDHATGQQVIGLLRAYCAETGASLLLATHDRGLLATFDCVHPLKQP